MKVFTPHSDTAFPVQRGDSLVHRILRKGEPYLLTETAADKWDGLLQSGLAHGRLEEAEERPVSPETESPLFFLDGEIGDAVIVRAAISALLDAGSKKTCGFVSPNGDWSLLPFAACPVFEFPVSLRQAEAFGGWAEFNFRLRPNENPVEAFAALVGTKPRGPLWILPMPALQIATSKLLHQTDRRRLALATRTRSHYRSWYAKHACTVMEGLVGAGFDCFLVGGLDRRVEFRDGQDEVRLWGDGKYDTCGLFSTVEEQVAFLANMDGVIAPDGGDLQVACALQKPTLGLFWCTSGEVYKAYAPTLTCLQAEKDCAPCWPIGDRPPCDGRYCATTFELDPEVVVETAKKIIGPAE